MGESTPAPIAPMVETPPLVGGFSPLLPAPCSPAFSFLVTEHGFFDSDVANFPTYAGQDFSDHLAGNYTDLGMVYIFDCINVNSNFDFSFINI